jgi:hypothetical protein
MSKPVKWAVYAVASLVQNVSINHSRSYILVPHQFFDGSDIRPGLKKMGGRWYFLHSVPVGVSQIISTPENLRSWHKTSGYSRIGQYIPVAARHERENFCCSGFNPLDGMLEKLFVPAL